MAILALYVPKPDELTESIAILAAIFVLLCVVAHRMKLHAAVAAIVMAAGTTLALTPDLLGSKMLTLVVTVTGPASGAGQRTATPFLRSLRTCMWAPANSSPSAAWPVVWSSTWLSRCSVHAVGREAVQSRRRCLVVLRSALPFEE